MTKTVLVDGISYAGRHFPAGTIITPYKGGPTSGGYFYAMAQLDDREYLISIRECDTTTVEDAANASETPIGTIYTRSGNAYRSVEIDEYNDETGYVIFHRPSTVVNGQRIDFPRMSLPLNRVTFLKIAGTIVICK